MTKEELKQYIDENVYENQDGDITGEALNAVLKAIVDDGGTKVEANPTGTPTETMQTIKIGEKIYTAPEGPEGPTGPANALTIGTVQEGEQAAASITGEAPNQQLNLTLPKGEQGDPGQNAVNPFKGWFTTDNIPTEGQAGDYCNVSDTSTTPPTVTIYRWSTTTNQFEDTGEVPDPATGETFASGETLQEVAIDNSHLENPVNSFDANKPVLADARDVSSFKHATENILYDSNDSPQTIDVTELEEKLAVISTNDKWTGQSSNNHSKCAFFPLNGISKIKIDASGGIVNIALLKSDTISIGNTPDFSDSYQQRISIDNGSSEEVTIPSDAHYLYMQTASSGGDDVRGRITLVAYYTELTPKNFVTEDELDSVDNKVDSMYVEQIVPELEIGAISTTNGADNIGSFYERKYWRTCRYIMLSNQSKIVADVITEGEDIRFYFYDENFNFLTHTTGTSTQEGIEIIPVNSAKYMRVRVGGKNLPTYSYNISKPKVTLFGEFCKNWDTPLNRPASGETAILVPVFVSNPNTCEAETSTIQDQQSLLSDRGLFALPETYSVDGEPTRLIIYCHGAGVNYTENTDSFDDISTDLDPTLFLKEGYAIMDIEGNPYNDIDEHVFIPAARESYISAYEYIVRKYNIRKDGILLAGRSMGGGMCFDLLLSRLPIIAACPVVPAVNTIWWWEYMNASRRQFVAEKMGFTGTAPTWTTGEMTDDEWQYLQDNFDKFIRYSPFFALMPDTPSKEDIFSVGNTKAYVNNTAETQLYSTKHFKTKAPVKMFAVRDDETVKNSRNCDLIYLMMINSAQIVELRYFQQGGHHYELAQENRVGTYVTSYGETLTNVPITYIEILAFWRRYEQGD